MTERSRLAGSALSVLPSGVAHLDPAEAVFGAMIDGWAVQQRSRLLSSRTVGARRDLIRRVMEFCNEYPWSWGPADVEAFLGHLRSGARPIAASTARGYVGSIRQFLDYVTDPRYGWPQACLERFGRSPEQVLHEWNTIVHVSDYEGDPRRRPLTYDEIQALFDAADGMVEQARARRRKGALAAHRDAVLLKAIYAFGLRRSEAWGLDVADLRHNPKAARFGRFGAVMVRHGKASRGGRPKRRTVLTVPEMDWVVAALEQWVDEIRPLFGPGALQALWVSERCARLSRRSIHQAFDDAKSAAFLPEELDLHCLRHSYVTHLVEFDYPQRFVQEQVGHVYASTTAIYTGVSDEYRNRLLQQSLTTRHAEAMGPAETGPTS